MSESHPNLYQYVFNNPYRYQDPNGESVGGYLLCLGQIVLGGAIIASGFTLEFAMTGAFTIGSGVTMGTGLSLMRMGLLTTNEPHTQLGTRDSKRRPGERYPQAREFGKDGKPIKTIDFTDHAEPLVHPNPHVHPCDLNPTGGTPKRADPQPLETWKY